MLQTLEDFKKVEMTAGPMVNGIDNANLLSVDSTEPIETPVDTVMDDEEKAKENVEAKPDNSTNKADDADTRVKTKEKADSEEKAEKKADEKTEKPTESLDARGKTAKERIGDLTKKWRTAEREGEFLRAKNIELETELAKLKAIQHNAEKPVREDFDSQEEFVEALTDWKVEQKLSTDKKDVVEKKAEPSPRSEDVTVFEKIAEAGKAKYSDFKEVALTDDLDISASMAEAISLSSAPEDILYFLGTNPDISADISVMSPAKAVMEIVKLERQILQSNDEAAKKKNSDSELVEEKESVPAKKVTSAPKPITPVKADGVTEKDPLKMSPKEYRAWRESGGGGN